MAEVTSCEQFFISHHLQSALWPPYLLSYRDQLKGCFYIVAVLVFNNLKEDVFDYLHAVQALSETEVINFRELAVTKLMVFYV